MTTKTTVFISALIITACQAFGQKNKEEQAIVNEGRMLYRSEMASWYGTDLFLEKFPGKRADIGGYFSYAEGRMEKCIFFSRTDAPKVLATITFDSTYSISAARVDTADRGFTPHEEELAAIRRNAFEQVKADTMFIRYEHTNFNFIPLVEDGAKKVFILTGPEENGVVIFGNDYLLTFDRNNKLVSKKRLHRNLIPVEYAQDESVSNEVTAVHTHLPETGELITSTDICTLMLYEKFAKWKSHMVVGEKTLSIWTCATDLLAVVPKEAMDKINKDQEKKHKDK